jgi:beta-fructofuranosidase
MPADLIPLATGEKPGPRPANPRMSLISIESSFSSTLPDVQVRAAETAPVQLNDEEPLKLRIFIDKSVLEVFVNGKQCVAMRIYPGRDDST